MMRDIDLDLPLEEELPEVQVYLAKDGEHYEEFDIGFFRLIEKYDGGNQTFIIEIRKPKGDELIMESVVRKQCKFQREQAMVITWSDRQQPLLKDVGISFLSRSTCDFYWKKICKKLSLDICTFDGSDGLKIPSEQNFDSLLQKIRKDQDIINHYILYSDAFKKALWQTFDKLRQNERQQGVKKIQNFMDILLNVPDKYILQALIDGPNFQHFLKIYQKNISKDLFTIYQKHIHISKFVELSQQMEKDIELIERIRFLKESVLNPIKHGEIQRELQRLSNKARVHFIENFIKNNISQTISIMVNEVWEKGTDGERQNISERFYQFYSQYLISFVPLDDSKLKTKIFRDFLDSGLFEVVAKIIKNNNYKVLQFFFNLANDNQALFSETYFQDISKYSNNSLHAIICSKFITSESQEIVLQCTIFFEGLAQYLEKNPAKKSLFNEITLPIIFSGCARYPLRVLSLINTYVRSYNEFQVLHSYIISSDYYSILLKKLMKNEFKRHEVIEILFVIKINLMSYGFYFLGFKKHLESPKSLESYQPDQVPSDYKRNRKYFDQISQYVVSSGLLGYYLHYLKKNIYQDSMINSAILSLIRMATLSMKYNPIIRTIREYDFQLKDQDIDGVKNMSVRVLRKYIKKLMKISVPLNEQEEAKGYDIRAKAYEQQLESERQENYLMKDMESQRNMDIENSFEEMNQEKSLEELRLIQMKEQMKKQREEQLLKQLPESKPQKKVKKQESEEATEPKMITFNFQFPEQ